MTKEDILDILRYQCSTPSETFSATLQAMDEYAKQEVIKELEELLDNGASAIHITTRIELRIKQLKGE